MGNKNFMFFFMPSPLYLDFRADVSEPVKLVNLIIAVLAADADFLKAVIFLGKHAVAVFVVLIALTVYDIALLGADGLFHRPVRIVGIRYALAGRRPF